ncbi:MAG: hypothetical protein ACYCWW_01130, partial [Deltaproteobacteria bacterium]
GKAQSAIAATSTSDGGDPLAAITDASSFAWTFTASAGNPPTGNPAWSPIGTCVLTTVENQPDVTALLFSPVGSSLTALQPPCAGESSCTASTLAAAWVNGGTAIAAIVADGSGATPDTLYVIDLLDGGSRTPLAAGTFDQLAAWP